MVQAPSRIRTGVTEGLLYAATAVALVVCLPLLAVLAFTLRPVLLLAALVGLLLWGGVALRHDPEETSSEHGRT